MGVGSVVVEAVESGEQQPPPPYDTTRQRIPPTMYNNIYDPSNQSLE